MVRHLRSGRVAHPRGCRGTAASTVAAALALGLALAVVLGACSEGTTTEISAGDGASGSGQPVLAAVLEAANAQVTDFGDGWTEVDRWHTEGSMTHWDTGCSDFDRLGDIFNHGTPETVVWARGDDRLFQRTDDFTWDAGDFAAVVERIPSSCPTVDATALTVAVDAVDPTALGPAAERITEGDPQGRVVAIALDAYPHPSLETDIATPEFEPDQPTWMVVATRHNVVSQVVYAPADGDPAGLPDVVAAQVDALLATPIEAHGPIERPAPPPLVAPGTALDVELFVDSSTCRNDGFVDVDGVRWSLAEPIPFEWRGRLPIVGDLAMDGIEAEFTAHAGPPSIPGEDVADDGTGEGPVWLDGFTVAMTTGMTEAVCHSWHDPESESGPPSSLIGRLDCDDRPVNEAVFPDTGQDPEDLAMEANPQTVRVESDGPLQWSGINGGGWVVVALFLGDADDADWQVFTCG